MVKLPGDGYLLKFNRNIKLEFSMRFVFYVSNTFKSLQNVTCNISLLLSDSLQVVCISRVTFLFFEE